MRVNRLSLVAVVAALSLGAGCAEERDPISRVQPNALPKSFFVGSKLNDPSDDPEFYGRSILVQVDYGSAGGGLFSAGYNTVNRVRWSIEEKYLLGRLAYERIKGTDGAGTPKPAAGDATSRKNNDGEVVYKFPILSHFDVRRSYNPSTGEEQNTIEENTQDRPWYEREYVRVDWTRNENTSAYRFDLLSMLNLYGVEYSPADFTASNPNFDEAPVFDIANGYMDATAKVFAKPKMIDRYGIPACWVSSLVSGGTEPIESCNEHQLTVRHSFKRVVDNDYEAAHWDGQRFETYGAFTIGLDETELGSFDREYGLRDSGRYRGIQRYNIWKRSHVYTNPDKLEGPTRCIADADCSEISPASRCDTYRQKNICTLPYTRRETKPVVFHYVQGGDPTYFDATRDAVAQWDAALRLAVAAARTAECKTHGLTEGCGNEPVHGNFSAEEDLAYLVTEITACRNGLVNGGKDCESYAEDIGRARGYADDVIALAKEKPMVLLCHSPVEKGDDPLCGPEKTIARMGDLRFNLINAIARPEVNGPWGIMTDANDPETGEKVAANVTSYVAINDSFAASIVDKLQYIAGEVKTEDVTDGTYITRYRDAVESASKGAMMPLYTSSEVNQRVAAVVGADTARADALLREANALRSKQPELVKRLGETISARAEGMKSSVGIPSVNAALFASRRDMAKNSPLEAAVVTPAMMQLTGVHGSTPADLDRASVFRTLSPEFVRDLRHRKEMMFAERGACEMYAETPAPLNYIGLRGVLEQKFGAFNPNDSSAQQAERAKRMKDYVRRKSHMSVIAHELGHSFGLRHNFVSSSDALNFRPQYWQLRTGNGKVSKECTEKTDDGASCVGPRWFDPLTPDETNGLVSMWAHSSIMEYPGEVTQDFLNLGRYDFGAARMFYGDTVAVLNDANEFGRNTNKARVFREHGDEFGGLLGITPRDSKGDFHYSQIQSRLQLIRNCKEVDPNAFKPGHWDEAKDGVWNPLIDGHLVTVNGKVTRCEEPSLDFVPFASMAADAEARRKTPAMFDTNRVRWTHGFASDNWADLGNVSVYRHDSGADLYEQLNFWIAQQELGHIFTSYRRGSRDFSIRRVFNGNMARYHEKMRDAAKALGLYATLARDTTVNFGPVVGENPQVALAAILTEFPANAVASAIAFDHFTHIFARPQPGTHAEYGSEAGTSFAVQRSCDDTWFGQCKGTSLVVPNGVTGNTLGYGTFELGGRPVNNDLATTQGRDYNSEYFTQAGSYYEKAFTAMLFTESADNFISSSRGDFVDPRYRSVSMADVFPDGFRRWLANNLTGDDFIKGVRAQRGSDNTAQLGWTSWWPTEGPRSCFPNGPSSYCFTPGAAVPDEPAGLVVVDPQVGWEQQRFAYIFSLLYVQENQRTNWLSQMQLWELGIDGDPGFANRIEFHAPNGKTYVAKTFGTEVLFGKTVQRGVAARVLEYANELLRAAYEVDPVVVNGATVGYTPKVNDQNMPILKTGTFCPESVECTRLEAYESMPSIMREALGRFGFMPLNGMKGVY
jgi:hypothetical protein